MTFAHHMQNTAELTKCYHCGADCENEKVKLDDKLFCCAGCKTVYEILQANDMQQYYEMNMAPGQTRQNKKQKNFAFLENEDIQQRLLDFSDDGISVIRLYLPQIHCSSCIWLLENLGRLKKGATSEAWRGTCLVWWQAQGRTADPYQRPF